MVVDSLVGDQAATQAAFATARHVIKLRTDIQRVTGVPMEPRAALGHFDAKSGRYTLYAGGGAIVRPKKEVAIILGIEADKVRVIAREVGGNFGTRNSFYPEFALVCWASRRVGRPVKWTCERSEAFLSDYAGRDISIESELALDADGTFLGLRATGTGNLGAYTASFVPLTKGTQLMTSLYRMPAMVRARGVLSNRPSTAPYRSAGRPEAMFVIERLIDLAAQAHGFDRIDLRRRNLITTTPHTNAFGVTYDSGDYLSTFDAVLKLADWTGFARRRAGTEARGLRRGIGLGGYVESQSGAPSERAGSRCWRSAVRSGRHAAVGPAMPPASPSSPANGWACRPTRCACHRRQRPPGGGLHSAALDPAGHDDPSGLARHHRPGRKPPPLAEAAERYHLPTGRFTIATDRGIGPLALAAERGPIADQADVESRAGSYPYGWHVCEVEVDAETGLARIDRYTTIDDVGRAVNPLILHGQTHGGIAQGAGQALMERCFYAPDGQLLSGSFMDYAMPHADDFPSFTTALSEVPSTNHPLGFRGGGEGGITPALGVIVNAVVDALADLGVTHIDMPASPERVWQAIRDAKAGG